MKKDRTKWCRNIISWLRTSTTRFYNKEEERIRIVKNLLKEQQTKAKEFKKQIKLEEKIKKELEQRDRELRENKE